MHYVQLSHPQLIRLSGAKTAAFLQGQVSCDVSRLTATQAIPGAYCNLQGRVFANFVLMHWQEAYYLWLPQSSAAPVVERLKKYAQFSDVSVTDVSADYAAVGMWGTDMQEIAAEHRIELPGNRAVLFALLEAVNGLVQSDWIPSSENAWETLAVELGEAQITDETRELFLPHELQYHRFGLLSFDKGCYLGQEIIARMHYRGKSKVALYRIAFASETVPVLGELITNPEGNALGRLVNCVLQADGSYCGLAVLPLQLGGSVNVKLGATSEISELQIAPV